MARSLSVRNIDDALYQRLKERASRNGVSMEEEVRRILFRATSAPNNLGTFARSLFRDLGADLELPVRNGHEPPVLDS